MEITLKLITAMPERSGVSQRGNAWKSREFVGEEINVQYPHKMVFEVYGEDKLNSFNLHSNNIVKVYFDIDAREYNGKWYNSVRAWKVEHCDAQGNVIQQTQTAQSVAQPAPQPVPQSVSQSAYAPQQQNDDNVPF